MKHLKAGEKLNTNSNFFYKLGRKITGGTLLNSKELLPLLGRIL
jgi:hypothetical protein